MEETGQKQIGKRKDWKLSPEEADQWLKTVHQLRGGIGVCKRGLYKNSPAGIGLRLVVSIAATELAIMVAFNLFAVGNRIHPVLVDLADTSILSLVASFLIFRWAVNPMKIFEERKKAEDQVHFLAYYDGLTGLPNRNFFKELLNRTIEQAKRYHQQFAVIYVDLDDFKRINDTLGHDAGDLLLKQVSSRLLKTMRTSDLVARVSKETPEDIARMGGDEFVILLHGLSVLQNAGRVARRILTKLSEPNDLNGQEIFMTASIGISVYPDDGEDVDNLIKNADTALYQAKSLGKNNYQYYTKSMNVAALKLLTMETNLHKALERNEFLLYYQPKMDLTTRGVRGMEALLRWKHPDMSLTPPSKFIPLAETSGLILPIGKFVLNTACWQNKKWQETGLKAMSVAVNISGRQFDQKDLLEQIYEALSNTGLSPQCLEIEITESTAMRNPEEAIRTLLKLKSIGVRISLDDFGTGYSSLSYLRRFPIDALKIDISFIRNVVTNPDDAAIVRTVIAMAHSLNLEVIAEGVENEQQLAFLQENGCDAVQGFLFSPPLPAEEVVQFLKE